MAYGYVSSSPDTSESTETTVARHEATIKSLVDEVRFLRRKLATVLDNHVEPDDIENQDALRNCER